MSVLLKFFLLAASFLILVVLIIMTIYMIEDGVNVVDSKTTPPLSTVFSPYGQPINAWQDKAEIFEKLSYWRAMRKFPNIQSCTLNRADPKNSEIELDWNAMWGEAERQVCVHHLSVTMGSPEKITQWFEKQGYNSSLSKFRQKYTVYATIDTNKYNKEKTLLNLSFNYIYDFVNQLLGAKHIYRVSVRYNKLGVYPDFIQAGVISAK